jgi:hypothetical protein
VQSDDYYYYQRYYGQKYYKSDLETDVERAASSG